MKKIKVVLLLMLCVILSGCSVQYTLNIDENLNFSENVKLYENNEYFTMLNQTVEQYTEINKEYYVTKSPYKNFDYKVKKSDNQVVLEAKNKKMDIEKFNNYSIVYNTLFSQIVAEKNGNELKIITTDYDGNTFFREPYSPKDVSYDQVEFIIKTPLRLISTNADIIDEEKGIYTWNFKRNDPGKNISIVLDTNVGIFTRLLILIKRYWYVPIIIIAIICVIIRMLRLYRNANKI